MGIWSSFKKGVDAILYIRPKRWVSWDFLKKNTQENAQLVKSAFTVQEANRKESFSQAVHRHGLTETEIQTIKSRYTIFSYLYTTVGLALVLYSIQAFFEKAYLQSVGTICLSSFVFSMAFRYSFWAFQIRKKRLGCTFRQWWNDLCGRGE